jgi:hypothetical protein
MNLKMTTASGRQVDPLNLTEDDITIEDIAHHLARINRFNGATKRPISVAQHSVYVRRLLELSHKEVALQALLHDATEAYLSDMIRPLKVQEIFSFYREIEDRAHEVIAHKFGFPAEMYPEVSAADDLMVRFEAFKGFNIWPEALMLPPPDRAERKAVGPWAPWGWKVSEEVFLIEYSMIMRMT